MGTLVTIHVVRDGVEAEEAICRAFGWFHAIEERCTRFDERSELSQLSAQAGRPVPVSAMLYEAVQFALLVAEETGGAFDPTVGHRMEARGFDRNHRTGERVRDLTTQEDATYRDVQLDPASRTITLRCPLTLTWEQSRKAWLWTLRRANWRCSPTSPSTPAAIYTSADRTSMVLRGP